MVIEVLATYAEWKQDFLAEIDAQPSTTAKGDMFVQKILQISYDLSEADAIDATESAGSGDKGIDAVYITPLEEDDVPLAIVVQGKYGTAGVGVDVYGETQKFLSALKSAYAGNDVSPAVDKVAGVLKNGGIVRYVIATVEPLNQTQKDDLENTKKIANFDFGDKLVFDATNLKKMYNVYITLGPIETDTTVKVDLPCEVVAIQENAYIGATSLAGMYGMLNSYAKQVEGAVDSIYDRNIRKYLKRRTGSVNDGIYKTLDKEPSAFIAYNNGITIICRAVQQVEDGIQLDTPYIVNGCQTTRTLYDFMNTKFAGIDVQRDPTNKLEAYKKAFMAIKVLVVKDTDDDAYTKSITRFSNKQNAIRGKDFIALESIYERLKAELRVKGYFLETQAGEYDVLPKHRKKQYPKDTNVISSFEATLLYAAGILNKPHDTFGHSGNFMPGGERFDEVIKDVKADDLLVPWMIAGQAREKLGYTAMAQRNPQQGTEHRAQTRYLFLYLFFRLAREILTRVMGKGDVTKDEMYHMLKEVKADYDNNPQPQHPFFQLLLLTDEAIATYMALAEAERWYTDRNSFLKREELIGEGRIILATTSAKLKITPIANQIKLIMSKAKG